MKTNPVLRKALIVVGKILAVLVTLMLLVALVAGIYIFATPSIKINSDLSTSLITRYAPENLKIGFKDFNLRIIRPPGKPFSKQLVLTAVDLCVDYESPAVHVCIERIRLAFTGGFDGPREPNQSVWLPHIDHIEPLLVGGADVSIDLTAFPKSDSTTGSFDFLGFVRKEILPKWDLEGSRVEVKNFVIRTAPDASYSAKFDLQRGETEHSLEAILHEARSIEGPLRAEAKITVARPGDWGGQDSVKAWRVLAAGDLTVNPTTTLKIKADANVVGLQQLDFRIQAFLSGVALIREVRVEGKIDHDDFKGLASLAGDSDKSELQVLNFVNCNLHANLKSKEGGVRCGPQSVRLQLRERDLIHRPDMFVLNPEVDLKITNLNFGDKKSADYTLGILLDHLGIVRFGTKLAGHFEIKPSGVEYSVKGRADAVFPQFALITNMLKRTTYAIPAPLNQLDGAVGLQANIDVSQNGGFINYEASTRLDSDFQKLHLDVKGKTLLEKRASGGLSPNTDIDVSILAMSLSAPRFELRAPPAFKPDNRFGPITDAVVKAKLEDKPVVHNGKFKIKVHTASPEAIHIATNLTKSAIPITVDITFDDNNGEKSPVSGSVVIGQTYVELFKRNALVENIRVDFLASGDDRLNGLISINYGDYAISIILLGELSDPQVRFVSDPPLDDNQIVSVLLFGRPQHELGEEDRSSVANTKTAMADAVLGLGSLYLLASTPVESVGYDPDTGRVIARVGLGGGASLELGAGARDKGQGVGFIKRLSKDFALRTELATAGTTSGGGVSALIEWVKRF